VLQVLERIRAAVPFAYEAKMNGGGGFAKMITDLLSTKVPENRFTRAYDKVQPFKPINKMLTSEAGQMIIPGMAVAKQAVDYLNNVKQNKKQTVGKTQLLTAYAKDMAKVPGYTSYGQSLKK